MTPAAPFSDHQSDLARDTAVRGTVAVGLLGVALIHVLDGIGKYSETRYLFWMFMGLVVSSIAVAVAVLFTRSRLSLLAAAGLTASALAGYVLSRTTGLPSATGDIGNWKEPLGVATVFIEATILLVAVPALALAGRGSLAGRTEVTSLHAARAAA